MLAHKLCDVPTVQRRCSWVVCATYIIFNGFGNCSTHKCSVSVKHACADVDVLQWFVKHVELRGIRFVIFWVLWSRHGYFQLITLICEVCLAPFSCDGCQGAFAKILNEKASRWLLSWALWNQTGHLLSGPIPCCLIGPFLFPFHNTQTGVEPLGGGVNWDHCGWPNLERSRVTTKMHSSWSWA